MKKRKLPSPRLLRRLLDYDPETGELRWKKRPAWLCHNHPMGGRAGAALAWNRRFEGQPAFTGLSNGYRAGSIFNRSHYAHRVVWAVQNGEWPDAHIDHINGNPLDNRIENLRDVSQRRNCKNQSISRANTSGVTGVYWSSRERKWKASIGVDYQNVSLGTFDKKSDAIAARKSAENKYGFHPNHGRD